MSSIIAPSILACDFSILGEEIEMINKSDAEWIHIDVMDGMFVPNISFGFPILDAVRKKTTKVCDVHLMMHQPERYIQDFKKYGADAISVHYEACTHLHRTIQEIKSLGMKAGVVLNPHTPIHVLDNIIYELDYVLLMSVNPGFGGQKFIPSTIQKIIDLKKYIQSKNLTTLIQIDGGVDLNNIVAIKEAGADIMVAGSSVFNSANPIETITALRNK
jgi:ribulose-phosphate 3-epimerase